MSFCVDNSFGYYSGIEFLGHMVTVLNLFRSCQTVFQNDYTTFTVSAALYEGPSFSISSATLVIVFFIITILGFVIRMQTNCSWWSCGALAVGLMPRGHLALHPRVDSCVPAALPFREPVWALRGTL
uniref:Uncharacterized protein n=1 Tax=Rhinopithecus roxellana TaxID=61622 RepID=A0A2K6Q7E9_RHIRO